MMIQIPQINKSERVTTTPNPTSADADDDFITDIEFL